MMPFFLVQNKKSNPYCPYKKTAKINITAPLKYVNAVDCSMEKGHYHGTPARCRGVSP